MDQNIYRQTRSMVRDQLLAVLDTPGGRSLVADRERQVLDGAITPDQAAREIVAELGHYPG